MYFNQVCGLILEKYGFDYERPDKKDLLIVDFYLAVTLKQFLSYIEYNRDRSPASYKIDPSEISSFNEIYSSLVNYIQQDLLDSLFESINHEVTNFWSTELDSDPKNREKEMIKAKTILREDPKWRHIVDNWLLLNDAKTDQEKVERIDHIWDLIHHSGTFFKYVKGYWMYSKSFPGVRDAGHGKYEDWTPETVWLKKLLDFKSKASPEQLAEFASPDMQRIAQKLLFHLGFGSKEHIRQKIIPAFIINQISGVFTQTGDGISVNGSVKLHDMNLKELPVEFRQVSGNLFLHNNELTTLKGCPPSVGDNFTCHFNQLISLQYGPKEVGSNYLCHDNKLKNLLGAPREIRGHFYAHNNELESLDGIPEIIVGNFSCRHNRGREFTEQEIRKRCRIIGQLFT